MEKLTSYLLALLGACFLLSCHEHAVDSETPFSHFQDEKIIHLTIETDLARLVSGEKKIPYLPAKITLQKSEGEPEHFHALTKPRGVYRKSMCDFPPLKIRFPDEVIEEEGLEDFPTLKLVTHCKSDPEFEQLILKEYHAFKLYNVLTDSSFRVQLARVQYVDCEDRRPPYERYGFLIENPNELAERMHGRILGKKHGIPEYIHKPQYKLFTMFQFMIGNTDWALKNRHNVKLVEPLEGKVKPPIPVPYDFDFCGFVDAPYAVPHHSIPITDVTDRYFQWKGNEEEDFSEVVALFLSKKEKLLAVCEQCEFLSEKCKQESSEYLQSFFEVLESEEGVLVAGE